MRVSRLLVVALLGALCAGAHAQRLKVHSVAYIATNSPVSALSGPDPAVPVARAFVHRLRDLGYVDGRNLRLEMRSLEGDWGRTEQVVAELMQRGIDVLLLPTSALVPRVRKVAPEVPIVMLVGSNVMQTGLVQSLGRPGGNITGLAVDVDTEIEAKRLEMLLELAPGAKRVAFVSSAAELASIYGQRVQATARRLGVALLHAESATAGYAGAFAFLARERPQALLVAHGAASYAFRREIGELARASEIPSSCAHAETVAHGCLMSYGASLAHVFVRAADYVDKILKGARAGELPIEQPTVFELAVNLGTARAIGLEVPSSILLRADRVFD
ncbi:MAG: ABC transporter substrate-binding protein [Betaproteobacteria bacterium]|nr:ABC transporter substrate-binding protein [Betaproteobacteria bacterium]MDH5211672.1 ABC transporter substrate-binding protein [Betaproteobacteria bacterium]